MVDVHTAVSLQVNLDAKALKIASKTNSP